MLEPQLNVCCDTNACRSTFSGPLPLIQRMRTSSYRRHSALAQSFNYFGTKQVPIDYRPLSCAHLARTFKRRQACKFSGNMELLTAPHKKKRIQLAWSWLNLSRHRQVGRCLGGVPRRVLEVLNRILLLLRPTPLRRMASPNNTSVTSRSCRSNPPMAQQLGSVLDEHLATGLNLALCFARDEPRRFHHKTLVEFVSESF